MALLIYLDTHVVVWLYTYGADPLPDRCSLLIETSDDTRISPMVKLELQYLYEVGRVTQTPEPVLDALRSVFELTVCNIPFTTIVDEARLQDWTRDPFDRLIVAQAATSKAALLTKDKVIHDHYSFAEWQ